MRRIRTLFVVASLGAALLVGLASPADAAVRPARPAGASTNAFQFGVYYDLWACEYYGNALIATPSFSSYQCVYQPYPQSGEYHWYLYLY